MHVSCIVLEFEPTVECFLISSQLSHDLTTAVLEGYTLCVLEVNRSTVAEVSVCTRDSQVVVMGDSRFTRDSSRPVGRCTVIQTCDFASGHCAEVTELLCVCHTERGVDPSYVYITAVLELGLCLVTTGSSATFGRDKDDTVRTTGTIDSSSRTILEDVHRSDLVRRDVVDIIGRHTVHDIQRVRTGTLTKSRETTDLNVVTGRSRVRGCTADVQTGNLTLEKTYRVRLYTGVEVLCFQRSYRTCYLFLFLRTVTDRYNFLQLVRVLCQLNDHTVLSGQGLRCKTHVADLDLGTFRHVEREVTIKVRNHTISGTYLKNAGADSRFAGSFFQHGTRNLRLNGHAEHQHQSHQTKGECFVFHNDC